MPRVSNASVSNVSLTTDSFGPLLHDNTKDGATRELYSEQEHVCLLELKPTTKDKDRVAFRLLGKRLSGLAAQVHVLQRLLLVCAKQHTQGRLRKKSDGKIVRVLPPAR